MADYTLQIPDGEGARVVAAFCASFGYQAVVPDPDNPTEAIPNPVSADEFARQQIIQYILSVVANYEGQQAADHARTTAVSAVMSQITIT